MAHRPRNHSAPISLDLTKMLEQMGYIKRQKPEAIMKYRAFDTRTTSQLQSQKFSGMRANDMWNRFEIWLLGNLHTTLSYAEFFLRPERLNEWYCEAFGLKEINLDAAAQRDVDLLKERKALLSQPEVQKAVDALQEIKKDG